MSERSTASTNRQFRTSAKNRPATANTQTSAAPATVTNMRPVPGEPPRSVPEVGVGRLRSLRAGQELSGASRSSVTAAPLDDHCLHPSCRRASSVRRRAGAGGCRRTGRVSGPARAGPAVSPVRSRRPRRGRAAAGSARRAGRVRASPVAAASPVRVRSLRRPRHDARRVYPAAGPIRRWTSWPCRNFATTRPRRLMSSRMKRLSRLSFDVGPSTYDERGAVELDDAHRDLLVLPPAQVLAHTSHALTAISTGVDAELAAQNPSRSFLALWGSPSCRAFQASSAQTAPPEVPLRPTTRWSSRSSAVSSRERTPAVKAVWLPPP